MLRILELGQNFLMRVRSALHMISIRRIQGLQLGNRVNFRGKPIIDIRHGAKVIINDEVAINSINYGYHLNMFSPVKLYAEGPSAVITIGSKTRIHGSCLHAYSSIRVGKRCLIAANCQIFDGSGHDLSFGNIENRINTTGDSQPIVIEDDVWIGANSIILPGVKIGKGSIVGIGSVVTKDIPPMVIAAGNPARVIRYANKMDQIMV